MLNFKVYNRSIKKSNSVETLNKYFAVISFVKMKRDPFTGPDARAET